MTKKITELGDKKSLPADVKVEADQLSEILTMTKKLRGMLKDARARKLKNDEDTRNNNKPG